MKNNNNFGVSFRGKNIVHPGAYDHIDASAMTIATPGSVNLPIIIGSSNAGKPGEIVWVNSYTQALDYLKGGELLEAATLMYAPHENGDKGAGKIGLLVVNDNQRADLKLNGLHFYSQEYGISGNKVQLRISDGPVPGSKDLAVYKWDEGITEDYVALGALFNIQYKGDKEICKLEITKEAGDVRRIRTYIGDVEDALLLDLDITVGDGAIDNIGRLADTIGTYADYYARIYNVRSQSLPVVFIDPVEKVSIKDEYTVTGLNRDFVYTINRFSDLINVEIEKSTDKTPVEVNIENTDFVYLENGKTGVAPQSWVPYFEICRRSYADILVLLSGDEVIQAEAMAFITMMEQQGQRKTLFTGGGLDMTGKEARKYALATNSDRVIHGYPTIYHPLIEGGKKELPLYMTGALLAGLVCGGSPSDPITFDNVRISGQGTELIVGDPEIDEFILSGVSVIEQTVNGNFRVVQGLTTYTGSNNAVYREISVRRGADYISEKVRNRLEETFVGKKGVRTTPESVKSEVIAELDVAVENQDILAYDPRSIVVKFQGSVVLVDYKVAPVEPINFVLITSRFVPMEQL